MSRENTITDSRNVKTSEPEHELLQLTNIEVDCDVIVNANPVYHSNVKIEANAAYH